MQETVEQKMDVLLDKAFKGHDFTYRVEIEGQFYLVQTDYRCPFQVGDTVRLKAVSAVAVAE